MTNPEEERVLRYTLQLGVDPLDHVQKEIRETIAGGERDATEVMRLETERRRRIESESVVETERQQRRTFNQPPELPRRDAKQTAATQPAVTSAAKRNFAAAETSRPTPTAQTSSPTVEDSTATTNQRPLQVEVKAQREYIVKVEEDVDQLVERIAEQINTQLAEREQVILWRLNKRLADFVASRSR
ncbi:hypothetical protein [Blastopirellula retiformator]|uniref:Uncharacterized protein n=1 Tax=Blastopirellula retiformator TaxID=2527970 RepID=A0A5C5V9J2_9BACT|nr:hypothetical protein [Blastopirellula retiformator]TWT34690.1 hypothetical protein Enr8_21030 [Blastopirellula retiformator]